MRAGRWHVIADVALPCPNDLPAHAHADTLALLLWCDGQPVLVDTGTSTYQAGSRRALERSTAAHNTVRVDGLDSTEVWGAFRAGRRARPSMQEWAVDRRPIRLRARHDGYRWLPGQPMHERTWELEEECLTITDRITGTGLHHVEVHWHLPHGVDITAVPNGLEMQAGDRRLRLSAEGSGSWSTEPTLLARGFERTHSGTVGVYAVHGPLPITISLY